MILSAIVSRHSRRPVFASLAFGAVSALGFVRAAHADVDLTGRWRIHSTSYADIVQTGSDVTVSWTEGSTTTTTSTATTPKGARSLRSP